MQVDTVKQERLSLGVSRCKSLQKLLAQRIRELEVGLSLAHDTARVMVTEALARAIEVPPLVGDEATQLDSLSDTNWIPTVTVYHDDPTEELKTFAEEFEESAGIKIIFGSPADPDNAG